MKMTSVICLLCGFLITSCGEALNEEVIETPLYTAPKTRMVTDKWDIFKPILQKVIENGLLSIPLPWYDSYLLSNCMAEKEIALLNTRGCPFSTVKEVYESAEYKKDQELCINEINFKTKVEEYRNSCIDEKSLEIDKEWLTLKINEIQDEVNKANKD
jgi:hypothetical protein